MYCTVHWSGAVTFTNTTELNGEHAIVINYYALSLNTPSTTDHTDKSYTCEALW